MIKANLEATIQGLKVRVYEVCQNYGV